MYAIGYALYGFVSTFLLFNIAMVIITIGEMIVAPVGQALSTSFAPEQMRGRYLAIQGHTIGIAYGIGPLLAGRHLRLRLTQLALVCCRDRWSDLHPHVLLMLRPGNKPTRQFNSQPVPEQAYSKVDYFTPVNNRYIHRSGRFMFPLRPDGSGG